MTKAYDMVSEFYGARAAKRSRVPLINHIDEGLKILTWLGEDEHVKSAYCLHPMLQDDSELSANWASVIDEMGDTRRVLLFAMEYRSVANEFLRHDVTEEIEAIIDNKGMDVASRQIRLSPLKQVNNMLIADKVQNRKDFELYHKDTHPNRRELDIYFKLWLIRLGISEEQYHEYVGKL